MFNKKKNQIDLQSKLASVQTKKPAFKEEPEVSEPAKEEVTEKKPPAKTKIEINRAVPDDDTADASDGKHILTMQQKIQLQHEENKKRAKEEKRQLKEEAKKAAAEKKAAEKLAKEENRKAKAENKRSSDTEKPVKEEKPVRHSKPERMRKERRVEIDKTDYSYETDIDEDEGYTLSEAAALARKERFSKILVRMTTGILIAACIYLVILIYGVVVTDYTYDDEGKIIPVMLSVKEVKAKKEFEPILGQYETCRLMYEKILMIDYKLSQGYMIGDGGRELTAEEMEERYKVIASEYQALISSDENLNINNLGIKLDALEVNSKYAAVKAYMITWLSDTSYYLAKMSLALSANDQTAAGEALAAREKIYNEFSIITQNIVALGDNVKGIDMTKIKEWSPEDYVDKQVNGE